VTARGRSTDEQPLRADLYNVDQLAEHAKVLARTHVTAKGRSPDRLIGRLRDNERVLVDAYDLLTAAARGDRRTGPAEDWLLDNFHVIEEQIRTARRHFPKSYSRELPRLASGSAAGHPRVYGIALELIAHVDGRFDAASLEGFLAAYQTVSPLSLGELWAVPIMLRLALIENLRRVASRIASERRDEDVAQAWGERMLRAVEHDRTDLILVIADMARESPPLSGAFLAELTRHLAGHSPYLALVNGWLEHRLAEQGLTIEHLVQADGRAKAADQVSVGNSITSLRLLGAIDWRKFVEGRSVVEAALRGDPAGVYAAMDFATRDRYRHAVEKIARAGSLSEAEVARKAIELAQAEASRSLGRRSAHVGYFLIDRGRPILEREARERRSLARCVGDAVSKAPLVPFALGTLLVTAGIAAAFLLSAWPGGAGSITPWALLLPALLCASHPSVALVNWMATVLVKPSALPRMDFRLGIPAELRTLVAVPSFLGDAASLRALLEGLEVRYLANRDENLHFALLTDLEDAPLEVMPGDDEFVRLARAGIEALNRRYEGRGHGGFFLLHRSRRWNAAEGVFMGYERKRGKLADLNELLRGDLDRFSTVVGDRSLLEGVRYVITLDVDTLLPRDAARRMVGAMAHPLNRPVIDQVRGCVTSGYTIMQPRVTVSLPGANASWFARLFSGEAGLDPYTRMVSDVYQDLFGEGSFIGKGIYDVDAFRQRCTGLPENAILSHDLLESAYARSALLTEVELFEEHPTRYPADVNRRHRWIRGDWQIGWWLLPWVPGLGARRVKNPISALSRWKIFDNLRRSLVPIAMLALLLTCWLAGDRRLGVAATIFVLAAVGAVPLLSPLGDLVRGCAETPPAILARTAALAIGKQLAQSMFTIVFLVFEAYMGLDAIVRTGVRMLWTKRRLLEWQPSHRVGTGCVADLGGFFRTMWIAPATAAATLALLLALRPEQAPVAAPVILLWLASPAIAWWLSRPLAPRAVPLSEAQAAFLGRTARRTWRYFEDLVTSEESWLPPDNVQENPERVVAPRTSPTNIGAALLADLAAFDFGYCALERLLERTRRTFGTLGRMERHRGHFYNWYDTRTLRPLRPLYVSTVDSGNLAGYLAILRRGLLEQREAGPSPARALRGLRDTARVVLDIARTPRDASAQPRGPRLPVEAVRLLERLEAELGAPVAGLRAGIAAVARAAEASASVAAAIRLDAGDAELSRWAATLERTCAEHADDLRGRAVGAHLASPPGPLGLSLAGPLEGSPAEVSALAALIARLDQGPGPAEVAALPATALPLLDALLPAADEAARAWLGLLRAAIVDAARRATERIGALEAVAQECRALAEMSFTFLYDASRDLFAIGYDVDAQRLDAGFYDLLASEARLASYVAIAEGQVGQEHWFAMGRLLTTTGGAPALLSWGGSMFEYLMPLLVMPTFGNTLLDETMSAVVRRQITYGAQRGVPWGISESGYNAVDAHRTYQYRAFGVPGLGLKRGLADDLVIAPYASALALMVAPDAACRNLQRLEREGRTGPLGFYEAVDYTPSRLPAGATSVTVRQYMAHHQGMTLLALAYALLDRPMQRRFDGEAAFVASDLLLQERVPRARRPYFPHATEAGATRSASAEEEGTTRVYSDPGGPAPEVHLLSNGRLHTMITSAGGGYTRWRDLAVTRWREDAVRDCWGTFCFLRDLRSGAVWSSALQPTRRVSSPYEAVFTQAGAEFSRRDDGIDTRTEVGISTEDDIELRRVTITNRSGAVRTIELTSYAEVVLAPQDSDHAHPAFSNLFVQTEIVRARHAILCTRRPRSATERPPWMLHMMSVRGAAPEATSFETDRSRFIGRGRTIARPAALEGSGPLSDTEGAVLDPVVAIRRVVTLAPGASMRVDLAIGVAESRDGAAALVEKYHDTGFADRVFELAWTHSLVMHRRLGISASDAQVIGRLAGSLMYASALRRAPAAVTARNRLRQTGLWSYGISGDLPIVLVRIRLPASLDLVRRTLQAHAYWRAHGLPVDVVIWNEDQSVYRATLQESILDLIGAGPEAALLDRPGGIFVRRGEQASEEDRTLLRSVARVVLSDDAGTLAEQVDRRGPAPIAIPSLKPVRRRAEPAAHEDPPPRDLAFWNGLGGFSRDGREYIVILPPGRTTPAPWINVIANARFGTIVSESGGGYTWAENSHEFRLTPWRNDPVSDASGEALYVRDEETGSFWSPTPLPARGGGVYVARHGFGYSMFEHEEDGIVTELCISVATDAPVKIVRLRTANRSGRPRLLSVTGYWEWVLGELRRKSLMHVVVERDPLSGTLFVRNHFSAEFAEQVVFVDASEPQRTVTADRAEFIGRNGTLASPAAMRRARLSGRIGAGLDPCAAVQVQVALESGQERDVVFVVGAAPGEEQARQLAERFRSASGAQRALEATWAYWGRTLGAVHVETPDPAVDFLANGWLVYQTLACRMWARTGFYQSGGAYGFRDQLQDAMALVHAEPALLRAHLLRAAARQFSEGDVQHWWHPPGGRGVRTRFSDDFLWLVAATCRYVAATGDTGVLDERAPYLAGRPLRPEEESYYDQPRVPEGTGTLYEHCVRAVDNGLRFGAHGLPLMGGGDWNDGMNLVGIEGKGESVWLAFFLYDVLVRFAALARARGDAAAADKYAVEAGRLRGHVEHNAWDGDWYLRAFFDDGTPLGSAASEECRIDALPQSWAVLSGAGTRERSRLAMDAATERLVRKDARLIQLLDPPFDRSSLEPGYIKGYVPGVRENGGQYTHAAIWMIMAAAELGDADRAWELFRLISPVTRAATPEGAARYRVEPYVVSADIYAVPPHVGRGGWTWYTGSAGWMYRLLTESLLGLALEVDHLRFRPRLPSEWPSVKVHYRFGDTLFHITIHNDRRAPGADPAGAPVAGLGAPHTTTRVTLDGVDQPSLTVPLTDDRRPHEVEVRAT